MGFKVDFGGVETLEFEPLPSGRYPVALTGASVERGSESDEPYIAWEFTVQGGDYDNRKLWLNTSLQAQALWATKRAMLALGVPEEELAGEIDDMEEFVIGLIGREGIAVTTQRMYAGEKRQQVRRILPSEGDIGEAAPF